MVSALKGTSCGTFISSRSTSRNCLALGSGMPSFSIFASASSRHWAIGLPWKTDVTASLRSTNPARSSQATAVLTFGSAEISPAAKEVSTASWRSSSPVVRTRSPSVPTEPRNCRMPSRIC